MPNNPFNDIVQQEHMEILRRREREIAEAARLHAAEVAARVAPQPEWVDFNEIAARPPVRGRGRNLFGNLKKKADIMGRYAALTVDVRDKLLQGIEEIFERPGFISGCCLTEQVMGAKDAAFPVSVTLPVDPDIRDNWDKWTAMKEGLEQLGWGQYMERPLQDRDLSAGMFSFNTLDRAVNLYLLKKPEDDFDKYTACINMVRYTLAKGLEIDPRCQKDIDKARITCQKKVDDGRKKFYETTAIPRYNELTGRKFSLKEK